MQGALTQPELLQTIARDVDDGRVAMLRLVSRETRRTVDAVRGARRVRLEVDWWAAQPGTAAQKTAALAARLGALAATRPAVGWLELRGAGLDGREAGLAGLLGAPLTRLDVAQNAIGGVGMFALRRALQQCPGLIYLDLSGNRLMLDAAGAVTHVGGQALGRVLREHRGLRTLLVGRCGLTGEELGDVDTAQDVATGLRACTGLTHLDLSGNFARDGMEVLVPTLGGLRALMELRLEGCRVEDGAALAAALLQCAGLRVVDLQGCELRGPAGLLHATWPQLPALEDLDVGRNSGDDGEVAALAEALPRCLRLRRLRLTRNFVGDAATAELARALPLCVALRNLDVRGCQYEHQAGFGGLQWVQLYPGALARLRAAWAAPNAGGVARHAGWLQA